MRMRLALALVVTTEARPRRQIRAPLATARGEYLPGESAYSSLARRRPQRCARRRAPRAAILVLFGRDERKLRESLNFAGTPVSFIFRGRRLRDSNRDAAKRSKP